MRHRQTEANWMSTTTRLDEVQLAVPCQLRIVGDGASAHLYWSIDEGCGDEGWRKGEPVTDCLTAFMRLADDADPQTFLRFAERFGVLGVQADGRPGNPGESPGLPPTVVEDGVTWHVEPLTAWIVYARHARALLLLSEVLRRRITARGPIHAKEMRCTLGALSNVRVEQLSPDMSPLAVSHSVNSLVENLDRVAEHGLATQQQWLGQILSRRWLAQSKLTPIVRWEEEKSTLDLEMTTFLGQSYLGKSFEKGLWSPFSLFSVLAAQLAAAFTNAGRYSQCSECGELFMMQGGRRPRLDRACFCSKECRDDGERRRKRESAARRRARERAAS